MYQHYVTESRVAQYQQRMMDEATIARQVRASRRAEQATGQAGTTGSAAVLATWLRSLRNQLGAGGVRSRIANSR